MQPFRYERPLTVEAARSLLAAGGARALAGGTDLIPQLREGRRSAQVVVDLKHVPELCSISRTTDGGWRIGAAASVRALGSATEFAREHHALLEAARMIGSLQVQSRATLGGNLCNAAPSGDAVPLLISLGAHAEIAGHKGRRTILAENIPSGPGRTALDAGELLAAIVLPPRKSRQAEKYLRFTPRREMDIAIAGAGVTIALGVTGDIESARITLASVAPTPLRASAAEAHLIGRRPTRELLAETGRIAAGEARPISDTRGSADYRRHLVEVLTGRALGACLARLGAPLA